MQLTSSTGHATYACCLTVTKVVSIPHGNTSVTADTFPVQSFLKGNNINLVEDHAGADGLVKVLEDEVLDQGPPVSTAGEYKIYVSSCS